MADMTIEATGLGKRFGARVAVENLSFTARAGDVVGLLGANGAGKTTTIRLLTTVLRPTSGRFRVAGVDGTRTRELRRKVGVLPESAGYPGHLTGRDYLRYYARLFGVRADSVDGLLERVGLADRGGTRIATYSRGMRQRLGIARTLVNDPAVLFLDEPTLGLDPTGRRQVLTIVREVAEDSGTTVVLSTHQLEDVERVCSAVLVLEAGRLTIAGTAGEVIGRPQHGRLRVPPDHTDAAARALAGVPGLTVRSGAEPGLLTVSAADPDPELNRALRAVLEAGVPVLSFGAGLADVLFTGENG